MFLYQLRELVLGILGLVLFHTEMQLFIPLKLKQIPLQAQSVGGPIYKMDTTKQTQTVLSQVSLFDISE